MDPMTLDWGPATAEFQNEEKNSAVHILKHDLTRAEGAALAARFAVARVRCCARKLPAGCTQEVWFDDRGQEVPAAHRSQLRDRLAAHVAGLMFFAEGEA